MEIPNETDPGLVAIKELRILRDTHSTLLVALECKRKECLELTGKIKRLKCLIDLLAPFFCDAIEELDAIQEDTGDPELGRLLDRFHEILVHNSKVRQTTSHN